jgi:hypothetical protein
MISLGTVSPKGCNDNNLNIKSIKIANPKGCNDYKLIMAKGSQSRRDDIMISPLRGFRVSSGLFFYNLIIPSGLNTELI